MGHRML